MKELKPCPFCGGEALLEPYKARKGYEASIQCNSCLGRMTTITYDDEKTAVKKVIEAWNRRAGEQKGTDRMDRKEAVEILRNTPIDIINPEENVYSKYFTAVILAIEALQEQERKKGKWEAFDYDNSYRCTSCGEIWTLNNGTPEENNMNFCTNCGADMRGNKKLKQVLAKELGCDPDEIARIIT